MRMGLCGRRDSSVEALRYRRIQRVDLCFLLGHEEKSDRRYSRNW